MKKKIKVITALVVSSSLIYSACKKQDSPSFEDESTVAAFAIKNGFIEVSDVKQSSLDPIYFEKSEDAIKFIEQASKAKKTSQ